MYFGLYVMAGSSAGHSYQCACCPAEGEEKMATETLDERAAALRCLSVSTSLTPSSQCSNTLYNEVS